MIPNDDSFCELDPTVRDKFGIPVLRFHWKFSDHELKQAVHMQRTFADMISAMGGRYNRLPDTTGLKAIEPGGSIIHEVGGACMGDRADKSVANGFGQTWDVKNVFLTDGATFCSNADKNPTLTIMALAWRASDYLLDQMKRGEI
jgi:choline dehydrogenase-like flavoprotein